VEARSRIGWDYRSFGSLSTRSDARVTSTRHAGEALHRSGAQLSNDRDARADKRDAIERRN
jgi:hypothetical protein